MIADESFAEKNKLHSSLYFQVSSTFGESATGDFNDDTECLIHADNYKPPRWIHFLKPYYYPCGSSFVYVII